MKVKGFNGRKFHSFYNSVVKSEYRIPWDNSGENIIQEYKSKFIETGCAEIPSRFCIDNLPHVF